MSAPTSPITIRNTETFRLASRHVGDEFQIMVQLPRTYAATEQTYPALYLTDSDDAFSLMAGILHLRLLEQQMPEMILVGIGYGADTLEPGNQRHRDYPPTQASWYPVPGMTEPPPVVGGGAANFLRFIREELMPHIEGRYRADPARRAYSGVSFGGLFGAYVLFHQPDTFSRYVISSPSLWWDDRKTFSYEEAYALTHTDLPARVYLSVGTDENKPPEVDAYARMIANAHELAEKLAGRGYPNLAVKCADEEGGHLTAQPGALTKGLGFVWAKE